MKRCTPRSSVLTLLLLYTPNQTIYMKWSTADTSIHTDALTEQIQIQKFLLHHQLHALSSPFHFTEPEMLSVLSNPPFSKVCKLNSVGTAILSHLLNRRTTPKSKFQKSDAEYRTVSAAQAHEFWKQEINLKITYFHCI